MSGMTDARALADEYRPSMDLEVLHSWAAEAAARLRDEAAPENVAEDSYHFMADLLAPHVTDTHGGLPGSVVESFQMLLEHWNRTHTAQGEQQAVAWIKPDWSDPKNFDGKSPVTTYPQLGWTPLYIHPQPVAGDAVRALLAEWRGYKGSIYADNSIKQDTLADCADELEAALSTQPAPSEQVAASVAMPDEATLDRLASEAYEVHCNTPIGHFPNDSNFPKWRAVVRHVLAAAPVAPEREG